jgi:hypothetical protein
MFLREPLKIHVKASKMENEKNEDIDIKLNTLNYTVLHENVI